MPPEDALHFAILQKKVDEVKELVASGAVDLNKEYNLLSNPRPQRALVDAISVGRLMTEELLALGADPMLPVSMGMPAPLYALFTAAAAPSTGTCHCGHDAEDPDAVARGETNPPFSALQVLVEVGKIDLSHRYPAKDGEKTLLDFAVASGNTDLVKYLQEHTKA